MDADGYEIVPEEPYTADDLNDNKDDFLESYDFSGKTIVPFCTSGNSGIAGSLNEIQSAAPNENWKTGRRFSANATETDLQDWGNGLERN